MRSGPGGIVHGYRVKNAYVFVQDDIKVSQRLTLNLGVRWEYDGSMADKYGNAVTCVACSDPDRNGPATSPSNPPLPPPAG